MRDYGSTCCLSSCQTPLQSPQRERLLSVSGQRYQAPQAKIRPSLPRVVKSLDRSSTGDVRGASGIGPDSTLGSDFPRSLKIRKHSKLCYHLDSSSRLTVLQAHQPVYHGH
jgi:hypothetical protein